MKKRFPLSLFGPIFMITTWIIVGYLIIEIVLVSSKSINTHTLSPNSILMAGFIIGFCILAGLLPTWSLFREIFTFFTPKEIQQPKILGVKVIKWIDVIELGGVKVLVAYKIKNRKNSSKFSYA